MTNKDPEARHRLERRPPQPLTTIERVSIWSLFGKYDFKDLKLYGLSAEFPNVALIYGENGIGKTTLLKLIYSALSPEQNAGHRGFIGHTKFKKILINLSGGKYVSITRSKDQIEGDFTYVIFDGSARHAHSIRVAENGRVTSRVNPQLHELNRLLYNIAPEMVFVNDHRTIRSTYPPWDLRTFLSNKLQRRHFEFSPDGTEIPSTQDVDDLINAGLERLLNQTQTLFRDVALRGNSEASQSVGHIYLELARRMARAHRSVEKSEAVQAANILHRMANLVHKLPSYYQYSIMEPQPIEEMCRIITESTEQKLAGLVETLEPFIQGLEKRVDSYLPLLDMMSSFENGINMLMSRKRISCSLDRPTKFIDLGGESSLSASDLSSGERHLLYLCCAALLSRERPVVVLVDEPELSLNYKWQRQLIGALLSISGQSAQFVMATHSFEVISKHREAAVVLEPEA